MPELLQITPLALQSRHDNAQRHRSRRPAAAGQILETPCVESRTLSQIVGAQVFLKFENLQFTASFKERGACNKMVDVAASEGGARGVVAMSAGNHAGRGLSRAAPGPAGHHRHAALHARREDRTHRGFGANVVLHGDTLEAARTHAYELAEKGPDLRPSL
jgi:threonine dehydratase